MQRLLLYGLFLLLGVGFITIPSTYAAYFKASDIFITNPGYASGQYELSANQQDFVFFGERYAASREHALFGFNVTTGASTQLSATFMQSNWHGFRITNDSQNVYYAAYTIESQYNTTIYRTSIQANTSQSIVEAGDYFGRFELSTDESQIYYDQQGTIFRVPSSGGTPTPLLSTTPFSLPSWELSPQEGYVVAGSQLNTEPMIYKVVSTAGGTPITLAYDENTREVHSVLFTPDDTALFFTASYNVESPLYLYRLSLITNEITPVVSGIFSGFTISPDGHYGFYTKDGVLYRLSLDNLISTPLFTLPASTFPFAIEVLSSRPILLYTVRQPSENSTYTNSLYSISYEVSDSGVLIADRICDAPIATDKGEYIYFTIEISPFMCRAYVSAIEGGGWRSLGTSDFVSNLRLSQDEEYLYYFDSEQQALVSLPTAGGIPKFLYQPPYGGSILGDLGQGSLLLGVNDAFRRTKLYALNQNEGGVRFGTTQVLSVREGATVEIPFVLNEPSTQPVTIVFNQYSGSAMIGEDTPFMAGTLTFAPGETSKTYPISFLVDGTDEPTEYMVLGVTEITGATGEYPNLLTVNVYDSFTPTHFHYLPLSQR